MNEQTPEHLAPALTSAANIQLDLNAIVKSIVGVKRNEARKALDAHQKLADQAKAAVDQAHVALDNAWTREVAKLEERLLPSFHSQLHRHLPLVEPEEIPMADELDPEYAESTTRQRISVGFGQYGAGDATVRAEAHYTLYFPDENIPMHVSATLVVKDAVVEHVDRAQQALDAAEARYAELKEAVRLHNRHLARSHEWEESIHAQLVHSVVSKNKELSEAWEALEAGFDPIGAEDLPNLLPG